MNMMKKTGGFTLVELIVVIAILAILAAVAVPAYSGYIAKAEEAKDVSMLDGVKTAAVFVHTEKAMSGGQDAAPVGSMKVNTDGSVVVNYDATAVNLSAAEIAVYNGTFAGFSSDKYENGAVWNGEKWDAAS